MNVFYSILSKTKKMRNLSNVLIFILFFVGFSCYKSKVEINNLEENLKPKKKILFYLNQLTNGGGCISTIKILNNLNYSKYEMDLLLTEEPKSSFLFDQISKEVNIIRLDRFSSFEEFSKDRSYDLEVSSRSITFNETFINSKLSKKKIAWIHMDLKNEKSFESYKATNIDYKINNLHKMDKIITVSYQNMESLLELIPQIRDKTQVIYNMFDIEKIRKKSEEQILEEKNKPLQLVAIGRLALQKGFDRLLNVCYRLKNEDKLDFHLWIVGGEDHRYKQEKYKLENQIKELGLEDTINLLGFRENPYPYLREADVFVLSSRHESFCNVVFEAKILNKPIVSTNVSGPGELLKASLAEGDLVSKGEYGLLTQNSEEGIYQGLKQIITDENLRNSFINKNPDFSTFKTGNVVKQVEALFDEVMNQ
jgi:glycosyltransferase involved in cell wall biosynthesis